jgi:hypothetical protein
VRDGCDFRSEYRTSIGGECWSWHVVDNGSFWKVSWAPCIGWIIGSRYIHDRCLECGLLVDCWKKGLDLVFLLFKARDGDWI